MKITGKFHTNLCFIVMMQNSGPDLMVLIQETIVDDPRYNSEKLSLTITPN
jgi:hypothetical protein